MPHPSHYPIMFDRSYSISNHTPPFSIQCPIMLHRSYPVVSSHDPRFLPNIQSCYTLSIQYPIMPHPPNPRSNHTPPFLSAIQSIIALFYPVSHHAPSTLPVQYPIMLHRSFPISNQVSPSAVRGGAAPMGRWGHSATMIADSKMLVLGGQADDDAHQATLGDLYKFDFGTWVSYGNPKCRNSDISTRGRH